MSAWWWPSRHTPFHRSLRVTQILAANKHNHSWCTVQVPMLHSTYLHHSPSNRSWICPRAGNPFSTFNPCTRMGLGGIECTVLDTKRSVSHFRKLESLARQHPHGHINKYRFVLYPPPCTYGRSLHAVEVGAASVEKRNSSLSRTRLRDQRLPCSSKATKYLLSQKCDTFAASIGQRVLRTPVRLKQAIDQMALHRLQEKKKNHAVGITSFQVLVGEEGRGALDKEPLTSHLFPGGRRAVSPSAASRQACRKPRDPPGNQQSVQPTDGEDIEAVTLNASLHSWKKWEGEETGGLILGWKKNSYTPTPRPHSRSKAPARPLPANGVSRGFTSLGVESMSSPYAYAYITINARIAISHLTGNPGYT